jgi:hypothetical protein
MWCVPAINDEYVDRMEDVLEVYARPHDEREPVVCLDERPVVLREHARPPVPMRPRRVKRIDYEYVRRGTANIFCIVEPKTGRRLTHATDRRTSRRFAQALAKVARRYKRARTIHLVVDNLSTHNRKACVDTYGPQDGEALWRRFTVHYTPKHASWLNAAELEASLVARECLGKRRVPHLPALSEDVGAWSRRADRERRPIHWNFTVSDARQVFRYGGITTPRAQH